MSFFKRIKRQLGELYVPAKHHDSGLRISSRGVVKGGAINNTQSVHTKNLVVPINNLSNLAASMVVPNGHDSVFAVLFQR